MELFGAIVLVVVLYFVFQEMEDRSRRARRAPEHQATDRSSMAGREKEMPPLVWPDEPRSSGPALRFVSGVQVTGLREEATSRQELTAIPVDALGRYEIEYTDVDGVVSTRIIDVLSVEANDVAIYLSAYCHLRGGKRTFRADRILRATDLANRSAIASVEEHFFEMVPIDKRPDPEFEAMMRRVGPSLSVLVWIARANNDIGVEEVEVLLAYIEERRKIGGESAGAAGWNQARALAEIMELRPTMTSCMGVVGRMSRRGKEYPLLSDYASRIAAMGGRLEEQRRRKLFGA